MNKQAREVTKADLIPAEEYAKNRKAYRKEIVSYKNDKTRTGRDVKGESSGRVRGETCCSCRTWTKSKKCRMGREATFAESIFFY